NESRRVFYLITFAQSRLERHRLIHGEAQLTGDHVDASGKEVGLQSCRVLNGANDNAIEGGGRAEPGRIGLQSNFRSGSQSRDPVGAPGQARIGGVGVEGGAVAVCFGSGFEDWPLNM